MKREAACSSETLVTIYRTTRHHIRKAIIFNVAAVRISGFRLINELQWMIEIFSSIHNHC
jgi:hypothetical protein